MSDDQFTKLFKYIEEFRFEVNDKFKQTQSSIGRLANTLDAFAKRLDDSEIEQSSRDLQFE